MTLSRPRPAELLESLGERAEALCAIVSPTGQEAEICGELEVWARALFPAVQRVKNSLVVWVDGERAKDRPLIALVGHEPWLGELAALLLVGDGHLDIDFAKSAVLGLHTERLAPGSATLDFFWRPKAG